MALNFNNIFSGERERVITSYEFVDLAKQRAVIPLYGGHTTISAANLYTLSTTRFYSTYVSTAATISAAGGSQYILGLNLNFDQLIELPMVIEGDIIVNVPLAVDANAASTGNVFADVFLHIIGKEGTNTLIGSSTTRILESTAGTLAKTITAVKINVGLTHLKGGDTFRLNIQVYGNNVGGGDTTAVYLGHDPWNSDTNGGASEIDWGTTITALQVLLPVRIDI